MKYRNILPTDENIVRTFCEDFVGRNHDVIDFCRILNSVEGPYTLAVDGGWGSGKSFYVKQVKLLLDYFNPKIDILNHYSDQLQNYFSEQTELQKKGALLCPLATVYFDAWVNDNEIDPLLSIMYAILRSYGGDEPKFEAVLDKVWKIADVVSGRNISALFDNTARDSHSLFAALQEEQSLHEYMNLFIQEAFVERGDKLVVFIDELDRCRPSYAVKLLERIKHFMSHEQLIIVFSTNVNQLQHTIKAAYGTEFDGIRYLNRFFDLPVPLAPINIAQYFDKIGYGKEHSINFSVCELTIKYFRFEIREIANYLQAYHSAIDITKLEPEYHRTGNPQPSLILLPPIMIGLNMNDKTKYNLFVQGEDPTPLVDILMTPDLFDYINHVILRSKYRYRDENVPEDEKRALLTELYLTIFGPGKIDNLKFIRLGGTKEHLLRIIAQVSIYSSWDK